MFEITNNNENKDLGDNYYENIKSYKEWGRFKCI